MISPRMNVLKTLVHSPPFGYLIRVGQLGLKLHTRSHPSTRQLSNRTRSRTLCAPARMTSNGYALEGPKTIDVDLVMQEICRRTFEVMFASARSQQQHGVSQWDLPIPPATKSEPYTPLPMEVDDAHRRTTTPRCCVASGVI